MSLKSPPPLFVAGMTIKVGEMVGFGPTPGWQYTNAVKVGRKRVELPYTTPPSFYEYDEMEYIHPKWDESLDYSKKKMPSRVWFNGMLYSPGRWLTSNQRGQKPNEAEAGLGSPRFRNGMNYPEQEDPNSRVVNQSHPFRIWKFYSKDPLSPHAVRGPNSTITSSRIPDGPVLNAFPTTTANERNHYTGSLTQTSKIYCPSPQEPWISTVGDDGAGNKVFKIAGYDYTDADKTPISASEKTGKMTTFDIVCINAEADFSSFYYYNFYGYYTYGHLDGLSLSKLSTQSKIDTYSQEWETVPNGNGARRLKSKFEKSIGGGSPANRNHYISESGYDLRYNQNFNPNYPTGFFGIFDVWWPNLVTSMPKQSCFNADGTYVDSVTTIANKNTGSGGNYTSSSKYSLKLPSNVYLLSGSTPFIYTRVANVQSDDIKSFTQTDVNFGNCTTTIKVNNDGDAKGKDMTIAPKRWGITVGGGSPDVSPKPGFQQNTFFCDKYSMGSAEYYELTESTGNGSFQDGSPCDSGHSSNTSKLERIWSPYQWGWVQ